MTAAPRAEPARALARACGLELAAYRDDHVAERIRRALERERVEDVGALTRLLVADRAARSRFRRSVAVSASGLFRDPAQFDLLERELLPALLSARQRLRIWSAGCADGSELYTVAILLERLGALDRAFLFGSDLLEENLAKAKRGVYGEISISRELRAHMRWERRDLVLEEPPPGKWNLVLCRNVAIYLSPTAKRCLHERLSRALASRGLLMLGRSERLTDPSSFGLEAVAPHVYRKVG